MFEESKLHYKIPYEMESTHRSLRICYHTKSISNSKVWALLIYIHKKPFEFTAQYFQLYSTSIIKLYNKTGNSLKIIGPQ